jgi:hypothetical protein
MNNNSPFFTQSRNFNTNTSHPLIPSSQEYMYYKKYVSIHSEDRNMLKYHSSSEFEIELPEDLLNVVALGLVNWTFPSNYNTFSNVSDNILMTFLINNPYNPNINGVTNILAVKTFECLFLSQTENFFIRISDGFYNPQQMVTELTNKFNEAVTTRLRAYFTEESTDASNNPVEQAEYITALNELNTAGGYNNFVIVYNNVSQKIWFGNICDGFTLTNEIVLVKNTLSDSLNCVIKASLPDFSQWGLPGFLGLSRCNSVSDTSFNTASVVNSSYYNGQEVPRFFYGDVFPGDNGFWLLPNPVLTNSNVQWVECPLKINFMGQAHFYMEIEGQNCIDETSPYNFSNFTSTTNSTNGVVNAAFAKIDIPTTPLAQWFDRESLPYKFYYPPAERMRKLYFRFRYHNGQLVNFGEFNYSFVLEFTIQMPQLLRASSSIVYPPPNFNR